MLLFSCTTKDHTSLLTFFACLGEWNSVELTFDVPVWGVTWSPSGNVLAVSAGDNRISLWKEKVKGGWESVKTIEE